jgi:hypothetical protein
VITQAACPWTATSDSGWLTTSSTGTGNGSVSYVVAANTSTIGRMGTITVGSQDFTVTQSGVLPTSLVATATSTSSVSITWNATTVDHFELWRNDGSGFALLTSPTTTSYTDNAVSPNSAYVYKVRAVDSGSMASAYSNSDLATTIVFTDDPLVPGSTKDKIVHMMELRNAVNIVRSITALGPFAFTDASLTDTPIKLIHVIQLRSALDPARSALGLSALTYTNISVGSIVSEAAITELRNGVK